MATGRVEASLQSHQIQLRENPLDPNVHSNYGAFVKEKLGDLAEAERAYRKAIELNPRHINALGNLANLMWEVGRDDEAKSLYVAALSEDPAAALVRANYARFVAYGESDLQAAESLISTGLELDATSQPLLHQLGSSSSSRGLVAGPATPNALTAASE